MTKKEALEGKPYAGNPHVRFDEGEVALAAAPRRGSLLYSSKRMFRPTARLSLTTAFLFVGSLFAGSVGISGFGKADTSSANTFWNVSGYDGGSVWREASASIVGFDTRSRTSMASSGVQINTATPGMVVVFR